MKASLHALLERVIDYAGLFPPAKLPLEEAFHNYARYRGGPEAWMLGRFIIPAARLVELTALVDEPSPPGVPYSLSVLGRGGDGNEDFLTGLSEDLETIRAFRRRHDQRILVDVLETRLPKDLMHAEPGVDYSRFFADAGKLVGPRDGLQVYFEPAFVGDWRGWMAELVPAGAGGLKIRCGGLEAAAFPSPEQLAFALVTCRDHGIPFKATAGLHHPIRHFDAGVRTRVHGFVNLFGAGVLAHARRLDGEQVRQILEDEDAGHFAFVDDGFRWKDWGATTAEVAAARQQMMVSFGSCSFDEPRDDLRGLGLLP